MTKNLSFTFRQLVFRARLSVSIATITLIAVSGCTNPFSLSEVLGVGADQSLTLSPVSIVLDLNDNFVFLADGGSPPYVFELYQGDGSIDSVSGQYTAVGTPGSAVVRVVDSQGTVRSATIVTMDGGAGAGALTISPSAVSLFSGQSLTFGGSGGTSPYQFGIVTPGSGSPTIDTNSGAYVAGGNAGTDTIEIRDSAFPQNVMTAIVTVSTPSSNVDYTVLSASNNGGTTGGTALSGDFTFRNDGITDGGQTITWKAYVSIDNLLDGGDLLSDTGTVPPMTSGQTSAAIPFGGTWPVFGGNYYLIVTVNAADDTVLSNNVLASTAVTITGPPPPNIDYIVTGITNINNPDTTGSAINETFDLQNVGTGDGADTVFWTAYLSADVTLDGGDSTFDSGTETALNTGSSNLGIPISGNWPPTSNTYYLIVSVISGDEGTTTNNQTVSPAFSINTPDIDYSVTSISTPPATAIGGEAISETFAFTNSGIHNGSSTVYWTAYASTDGILGGGGESVIDSGSTGALNAGVTSGNISFGGSWPVSPNTYYLVVTVSAGDDINTGNNWNVSGTTADVSGIASDVDYSVATVIGTGGTTGGGALAGQFTFTNGGTTDGIQTVNWEAYVSTDTTLGGGDILVDSGPAGALNTGQTSGALGFTGNWPAVDDTYYLIVSLSASDDGVVNNNTKASAGIPVTGSPGPDVDYIVTNVTRINSPATTGSIISESFDLQNGGTTNGSDLVFWNAYVSTDATLDGGDSIIDSGNESALNAGASSTGVAVSGIWPSTPDTYYLIVNVIAGDDGTPGNNDTASPAFTINSSNVDYVVTSVSNANTPAVVGSVISESFVLQNQGTNPGGVAVNWTAYISANNTVIDAGDSIADSGSTSALGSGASSGAIPVGGNWPITPGTHYLVVEVAATDDSVTGNNTMNSGSFNITGSPVIDYIVLGISSSITSVVAGTGISETFDVQNIGDTAGVAAIDWEVYMSPDNVYDGGDTPINSGTTSALAAGATASGISIGGTWATEGTYYLIARVGASDETISGWDDNFSGPFTVAYPPEYSIVSVDLPIVDYGGNVNEAMGSTASAPDDIQSFSIYNDVAAGDGISNVTWTAYLSTDTTVGGDQLLGTNTIAGFAAGTTQGSITFGEDDLLPAVPGWYYVLIEISAGDDSNTGNNLYISQPVAVWQTTNSETDSTEDDTTVTADDFAVILNPGSPDDTLTVNGTIDANWDDSDFFKFRTGPATANLDILLNWATVENTLDLFLYNSAGLLIGSSELTTKDAEPGVSPWTVSGLNPDSVYYVEVMTYFGGSGGLPYSLTITGY